MIFRVDDVSANTDIEDLNKTAIFLYDNLGAEILYCFNIFAKTSEIGSVYPDLPMRSRSLDYFMDVDKLIPDWKVPGFVKFASHGLIHANHGQMSAGAQELSIVTSCRFLKTSIFVTPFTSWDSQTERICKKHGIELVNGQGWKSMESEPFFDSHDKWFFHPWRMNYSQVRDWVNASKVHV